MASREPRGDDAREGATDAPDGVGVAGVPLDGAAGPLSWELGHRLTADGTAPVVYERSGRGESRRVRAYAVTEHTCVVAVRSPVGRERFYEVPRDALD